MRSLLRLGITAIATVAVAVGLAPVANAAPNTDYVALGDSYSSGVGTGSYDLSVSCGRSSLAYPALWARQQGTASFTFAACSGATTSSLRSGQLGGLSAATDLVTVTIGGNDADFVGSILACRLGSDNDCFSKLASATTFIQNTLPGRLNATYADIRSRAPNARLVVLGYPRLYRTGFCFLAISDERRRRINAVADTLATVTAQRAQAAGATFLDARTTYTGHEICSSSPYLNGPTWPITDSYHPNRAGYANGYLPLLRGVAA